MFVFTLASFESIPALVEVGTFGLNGGGVPVVFLNNTGESTQMAGVGISIKGAHPLHIDNAQPHDVQLQYRILSCHTVMIDI